MRYSVKRYEIRSENAAKPTSTPAQWLLDWIDKLSPESRVLDLGCGKLRYTKPLSQQVKSVVAVDSKQQVDRSQTIDGEKNVSVRQYVNEYFPNVQVCALDESRWRRWRYDRILVAYVLSAIPFPAVRKDVLRAARDVLKQRGGELLIATTFANSRFRDWERTGRGERYRDGFLIRSQAGTSFYGLIPLEKLRRYCRDVELDIADSGTIYSETAFVIACRKKA